MSYIGVKPKTAYDSVRKDRFTGQTGTTVTLSYAVSSVNDILVWVNGVKQDYTNYSVSSTTLTLGGTLVSSDIVEVAYLGRTYGSVVPNDGSVGTSALQDSAVTNAKIADVAASKLTGTIATARLGSGTASSSTVLYGDQTYKAAPSGGLTLLSMVDQDLGSSLKLQFTQVFSSDYDYYKVMGSFNLGSASAHSVEFRFLNSSNSEMTTSQYYGVAQGWRYSSSATDRSDWGQWGSTGVDIGRDIYGGSYYRKIVLDMDIHPDAYSSTTHNAFNWNIGYTKYQGGTEAVSRVMGYGQYANSTDLSGGGIQFETQNSYDFVNMGIYGVKTTT